MKKLVVKNLAAWLAVLLLSCGTVLAAYAPGTGETAPPAEEAAELQDAAGNVTLAPYTVNGVQRGYYVAGCASTVTAAVIPAEYQGLPVLHIGKEAFKAHKNLTSVVLPDSVETIGEGAFYDCYKLSSLTLPASAVFQGNNDYCCRDTESLSVRMTKGSGTMPDYTTGDTNKYSWTPWYWTSWYGHAVTVTIDDGVTNVGAYAFYDCDDISTVTAGKDLAAVGAYSFYNCASMTDAVFIDQLDTIGVGSFQFCKKIPQAIVKPGVTVIPEAAFRGCHLLKTVALPDSVTTIGTGAFFDCYSLASLTLPCSAVFQGNNDYCYRDTKSLSVQMTKGTGTMPDYTTGDTRKYSWTPWYWASWYGHATAVTIGGGVAKVGAYAFYDCDDITSVTAEKDLAAVGDYGFYNCASMADAAFMDQLDAIGTGAFQFCKKIPKAVVKSGVTVIPEAAFRGCHLLKTVVLPDSVTTIGVGAFFDCYSLTDLTLPCSVVFQGNNDYCCRDTESLAVHITKGTGTMPDYTNGDANKYSWTPWYWASWYGKPTTVTIGGGAANVGAYAFYDCDDITSVTAEKDLAAVGDYGFYNCASMVDAAFMDQLDAIGTGAFQFCKKIPKAVVKSGVTVIPEAAFRGCHLLKTVVLPDSVTTIGTGAFFDCYSLTDFTLPCSAVFQGNNDYCCRDTESLAVHITKGSGTMTDYTNGDVRKYSWTPWYWASWYGKPTTVTIGGGVANVGAYAFYDCDDIRSVTAGNELAAVGNYSFYNCASMEDAAFLVQLDRIGAGAFQLCKKIPEAVVKSGVAAIPEAAFQGCHLLKTVVLPDSVETVGAGAFFDCYHLASFTLPCSAVFLGNNDYCCRDTESLTVRMTKGSGAMPDYTTGDTGKYSWTPWYWASWYGKPTTVVIDDGVTTIGAYAFYDCDDIASLSIPVSVTLMKPYATYNCKSLKTVYYSGTSDQWGKISIQEYNDPLKNAVKSYAHGIHVSVLDSSGKVLVSADFHDLADCTIACTLYDAQGRMVSADLKASGGASFTAAGGAVRARLLFLSGDGYVPVRTAETLWLQAA